MSSAGKCAAECRSKQLQIEEVVERDARIDRRPAFACGLVPVGGGPCHFDAYENVAYVLLRKKTFYMCPHADLRWGDGEQNGEHNERLDVDPMLVGWYPEPAVWDVAEVCAGDVLYIPRGWWHYVVSEPRSLMTNVWF